MLEEVLAELRRGRRFQEIVRMTAQISLNVQGSDLVCFASKS